MANIKSAKKRARQTLKRTAVNRRRMRAVRTAEKSLRNAITAKDADKAQTMLRTYESQIDRAAKKGIVHRNLAARKVSRLAHQVSAISA